MVTRERALTVDDVWRLEQQPRDPAEKYYLIDGELIVKMASTQLHGALASEISRLLGNFVVERQLGFVAVESGHHPLPDVAFVSIERMS